jgi:hypothetical protein
LELIAPLIKLLENGAYGQIVIIGGIIHIIWASRSLQSEFQKMVQKVYEIDKYIAAQIAVGEALKEADRHKQEEIKDLKARVRELEIKEGGIY